VIKSKRAHLVVGSRDRSRFIAEVAEREVA
jgi:hypothetical protein